MKFGNKITQWEGSPTWIKQITELGLENKLEELEHPHKNKKKEYILSRTGEICRTPLNDQNHKHVKK